MGAQPKLPDRVILLGRVVGAFGVQGWVKIQTYTAEPDGLLNYSSLLVGRQQQNRRLVVEAAKVHGQTVLCKFEGVQDRDAAAALKGSEVGAFRRELPENDPDEVYWADLVGLRVTNTEGVELGTITQMIDNGAQSVMVVTEDLPPARERLIPFVPAFLRDVSLDRGVVVEWGADF